MSNEDKERMMLKDILSIEDIQRLTGFGYQQSAQLIRDIKTAMKSRFKMNGYVATGDYKAYLNIR